MAYRAEIEIGVKGANKLRDLQDRIGKVSKEIDLLGARDLFENKTLQNIQTYNQTLKAAADNLKVVSFASEKAAKATDTETAAIKTYVSALLSAEGAQSRQNRLIDEEIAKRRGATQELKAYNAALAAPTQRGAATTMAGSYLRGSFKGGSQFAGPIGPGPASSTALSSPLPARSRFFGGTQYSGEIGPGQVSSVLGGQSSPVAERLSQQLRDQAKLKASLLALDEKSTAVARERLSLSTQLKEQLNDIKVAAKTGPREPKGFSRAAGQESARKKLIMQEGAQFAAQQEANRKATIDSYNEIAQFAKKNEATVFGIRAKNIRSTLDLEFDKIAKQAAAEGKAADKLITRRISDNKKAEADFDKRLDRRTKAKVKAAADVRKAEKRIADEDSGKIAAGRKRRNDALSSGLIGGAFPLLFGQGGGAAIGGGIGGFAGGLAGGQMGFALSLVGTQFGAFADQIVAGGATLGQALNPLTADIEALATAAGFAGTEIGTALQAIEDLGTQQQALEAATALLAATVGNEGVNALNNFGADTADLGREFARAMTLMQTAAAKLFQSIPGFIANAIKAGNDLQAGLNLDTPEAKKLQEKRNQLTGIDTVGAASGMGGLSAEDMKELVKIENQLRTLAQERAGEAERQTKATSEQLQTTKFLSEFGLKNAALTKTELALASQKKDLTDADYVALLKIQAAQELGIKNKKAEETIDKNKSQFLKTNGSLQKVQNKNLIEFNNKIAEIDRNSEAAIDRKNKKLGSGASKLAKQAEQLARQEQQARNFTASLERQLAQSKVAGSQQAQKLRIEAKYEQTVERIAKLKNQDFATEQKALADQIRSTALANLEATEARKQAEAIRSAVAPIKGIREGQEASLAASKEYNRLLMEGVLPSEAKRIVEFNKQVEQLLNQKTEAISLLELDIARAQTNGATTTALQEQLDLLKQQKGAIESEAAKGPGKSDTSDKKTVEDRVAQLQGELTEMTKLGNVAIAVADNVGSAFGAAFQGVINGSKTTQEALGDMLKSVGESFVAMAAEIIVKQLTMIALQAVLKALGGPSFGGGGGGGITPPSTMPGGAAQTGLGLNIGGIDQGIGAVGTAANGGPVKGGQPYLIGERGPELFVPGQSGGVMRNEDMRSLMGRSPASGGAASMNFSFETTSIGGTEYVSREQLESAMAVTRKQASNDGAKRGMNMTLDKMQNSPRTRTRIGLR